MIPVNLIRNSFRNILKSFSINPFFLNLQVCIAILSIPQMFRISFFLHSPCSSSFPPFWIMAPQPAAQIRKSNSPHTISRTTSISFPFFYISSILSQLPVPQKQLHKNTPLHWLKYEVCCGCRGTFISSFTAGNRCWRLQCCSLVIFGKERTVISESTSHLHCELFGGKVILRQFLFI